MVGSSDLTHPEAIRARDCAMAIRCSAGRLSPAKLDLGGRGAAQAAALDEDTGPSTRAEGEGVQVEAAVEMSGGGRPGAEAGAVGAVAQGTEREGGAGG